jgi:hypothetical protein
VSARAHVLAILRQHGRSKADALAILDELGADNDEMAALGAFLSGRTDDLDIDPLEDLAHALALAVNQLIGELRDLQAFIDPGALCLGAPRPSLLPFVK